MNIVNPIQPLPHDALASIPTEIVGSRRPVLSLEELRVTNQARLKRWHHGEAWSGADWSNAMAGECGEACNIVKKLRRQETQSDRGPDDPDAPELVKMLADEIADTLIYADLLAAYYGIDLPTAIISKFNRVSERQGFPERIGLG